MSHPMFSVTTRTVAQRSPGGQEIEPKAADSYSLTVDDAETKRRVDNWLRRVAGVRGLAESRSDMLRRVARLCHLKFSRVENLYSREARRIEAWEYLRIEAAAKNAPPTWEKYGVPFPKSHS